MAPPDATQNTPLAPSVEKAYYRKCIELKRRLNEVEEANDAARLRKLRLNRAIMKMRLERAFLLEQLAKRLQHGAANEGARQSSEPQQEESTARYVAPIPGPIVATQGAPFVSALSRAADPHHRSPRQEGPRIAECRSQLYLAQQGGAGLKTRSAYHLNSSGPAAYPTAQAPPAASALATHHRPAAPAVQSSMAAPIARPTRPP